MEIRKQKGKQVGRLTVTEQIDQKHQEDLQRLRGFRLLDDDFLTKCFEGDTASIELVLQIVLEKLDLKLLDVCTQVFMENLLSRSVRLDYSGYGQHRGKTECGSTALRQRSRKRG